MKLRDIYKEQRLIALQTLIFSIVFAVVLVSGAIAYKKTTTYDQAKESIRVKKIDENKAFEQMYKARQSQILKE